MYLVKYNKENINLLKQSNDVALEKYLNILLKSIEEDNTYHIIIKDKKDYFANLKVV